MLMCRIMCPCACWGGKVDPKPQFWCSSNAQRSARALFPGGGKILGGVGGRVKIFLGLAPPGRLAKTLGLGEKKKYKSGKPQNFFWWGGFPSHQAEDVPCSRPEPRGFRLPMTASRAGLGSDLMSERSTPCSARKEQMFTTAASGGWGLRPPDPPVACVCQYATVGFFATVEFSSKCGDFFLCIHRKCTNTPFRHRSEDPLWRCVLRASGRAPENPVFGQDKIMADGLADAQKKVKFGYFLGTFWVTEKGGGGGVKTYFLGWKNSTSQNRDVLPPLYFLDSARIVVGSFLWSR